MLNLLVSIFLSADEPLTASILGTIFVGKGRKNPVLVLNNYEYNIHTKKENRTRWRCVYYWRTKCSACIYTTGATATVPYSHNHEPRKTNYDFLIPQKVTFVKANFVDGRVNFS